MKPLPRSVALTLFALVCGACLAVGCAQFLGIDDLPDGCDTDDECRSLGIGWSCNQSTHACEPPSAGNECANDGDCRADAPICGEDSVCRGCEDSNECDGPVPICGASGQCVRSCSAAEQCSDATPYCNIQSGICEACQAPRDNDLCTERDDSKPLCGPAGTCVACLDSTQCDESTPICGATNTCDGCKEHSDCAAFSGICSDDGACAPESAVVYVRKGSSADAGDCTQDAPCQTLTYASGRIQADNANKRYIRILDSESYSGVGGGSLAFSGIDVTVIGNNASISSIDNNKPIVDVGAAAQVTLQGVTLQAIGTGVDGVLCRFNDSSIRLVNVIIQGNSGIGVNVTDCQLEIERSVITRNAGGGIEIRDAPFSVVNSFILGNGSSAAASPSNLGGVRITNNDPQAPQVFAFNTVAQNQTGVGARASGVDCSVNAVSTVLATSSILRKDSASKPAVSGSCAWVFSNIQDRTNITPPESVAAPSNNDADCMLMNNADGLPVIAEGSACQDAGQPLADITIDIDADLEVDYQSDSRLATPPDMGADEI